MLFIKLLLIKYMNVFYWLWLMKQCNAANHCQIQVFKRKAVTIEFNRNLELIGHPFTTLYPEYFAFINSKSISNEIVNKIIKVHCIHRSPKKNTKGRWWIYNFTFNSEHDAANYNPGVLVCLEPENIFKCVQSKWDCKLCLSDLLLHTILATHSSPLYHATCCYCPLKLDFLDAAASHEMAVPVSKMHLHT